MIDAADPKQHRRLGACGVGVAVAGRRSDRGLYDL